MQDTADAIARDLVAEVGWWPAVGYMLGRMLGAGSWPRTRQAMRLLVAVVRHG